MLNGSEDSSVSKSKSSRKLKLEKKKSARIQKRVEKQKSERQDRSAVNRAASNTNNSEEEEKDGGGTYETVDTDDSTGDEVADVVVRGREGKKNVIKRSLSTADELYSRFLLPAKVSRHSLVQSRDVLMHIGFKEKCFLVLDDPQCCGLAKVMSLSMMVVIVLSCVIYVISTDPSLRHVPSSCAKPVCENDPDFCPDKVVCEPVPPDSFALIEVVCIVLFTLDYGLRALLVSFMPPRIAGVLKEEEEEAALALAEQLSLEGGQLQTVDQLLEDPYVPPLVVLWRYTFQVMNVIDVVAIVPFYIELGTSGSGSSIAIVRVLRLARMLRIFKASKYNEGTKLLSQTILRSLPVLSLLFFFTALGVVLFGSLIFFMEGGKYEVTEEYPGGAYMRNNLIGIQEVTPYTSIPVACYWVVVTATTVGFGDLYPTSGGGRLVACFCMYIGLLVLALPITVVGSNFTMVYEEKQDVLDEKERLLALRMESEKKAAARVAEADSKSRRVEDSDSPVERGQLTRGRSFSDSGLDGLALSDFSASVLQLPPPTPPGGTGSRRSTAVSHKQQLAQMQQQLHQQQAHMLHLHQLQMQTKAQHDLHRQQQPQQQQNHVSTSPSAVRAHAFKKHFGGKIKQPSSGVARVRRKSLGSEMGLGGASGEFDFQTRAASSCGSSNNSGNSNDALGFGISPQAVPHLVLSPPPSPDPGSGSDPSASASAVDSQATLQLALHMSRQLDQLIAQLQRQDTVIAHQQVRLARQEADIQAAARIAAGTAAGTGGVTGSTEEQDQEQEQDQDQDNSDQRDKPSSETVYVDI